MVLGAWCLLAAGCCLMLGIYVCCLRLGISAWYCCLVFLRAAWHFCVLLAARLQIPGAADDAGPGGLRDGLGQALAAHPGTPIPPRHDLSASPSPPLPLTQYCAHALAGTFCSTVFSALASASIPTARGPSARHRWRRRRRRCRHGRLAGRVGRSFRVPRRRGDRHHPRPLRRRLGAGRRAPFLARAVAIRKPTRGAMCCVGTAFSLCVAHLPYSAAYGVSRAAIANTATQTHILRAVPTADDKPRVATRQSSAGVAGAGDPGTQTELVEVCLPRSWHGQPYDTARESLGPPTPSSWYLRSDHARPETVPWKLSSCSWRIGIDYRQDTRSCRWESCNSRLRSPGLGSCSRGDGNRCQGNGRRGQTRQVSQNQSQSQRLSPSLSLFFVNS